MGNSEVKGRINQHDFAELLNILYKQGSQTVSASKSFTGKVTAAENIEVGTLNGLQIPNWPCQCKGGPGMWTEQRQQNRWCTFQNNVRQSFYKRYSSKSWNCVDIPEGSSVQEEHRRRSRTYQRPGH